MDSKKNGVSLWEKAVSQSANCRKGISEQYTAFATVLLQKMLRMASIIKAKALSRREAKAALIASWQWSQTDEHISEFIRDITGKDISECRHKR